MQANVLGFKILLELRSPRTLSNRILKPYTLSSSQKLLNFEFNLILNDLLGCLLNRENKSSVLYNNLKKVVLGRT